MKDFDLLSLNLNDLANNVNSPEAMNRINRLQHNMDRVSYERDYLGIAHFPYVDLPEDIEEGNTDLEMYEKWLKQ